MQTTTALGLQYPLIMPAVQVCITGILAMMYGAFVKKPSARELLLICLVGLGASGYTCRNLWVAASASMQDGRTLTGFSNMLIVDHMSLFFTIIFLVVAILSSIASVNFFDEEDFAPDEYYSLMMFATAGMILMAMANDMVMVFLGLEISSIATYVLAGYRRTDLRSNESALKYFILGSFSTAFLLYGIALVYGATGTTNLEGIANAIKQNSNVLLNQPLPKEMLFIGVAMMLIGFSFKIATAPFHVWTPDVYEGAPSPVTGFMGTGPKAAGFVAFMRIFIITLGAGYAHGLSTTWSNALQVIAILTMVIGNIVALSQTNIKRILAYSSIAHAGYALIGFIAGDWAAVGFYMLAYAIVNIGAFAVISIFAGKDEKNLELDSWAGQGFKSMGISISLLIFMLSLAGMPLTGGFMSKFIIFKSAWLKGYHTLVIVAVINSAISVYYYLRPMVALFFRESREERATPIVSGVMIAAIWLCLVGTFYLGVIPGWLLNLLDTARQAIAMR